MGGQTTSIKTKAARNKFPRKESTPETEDCESNTCSVKVEGRKFGSGVPRSMENGLTYIAEIFSVRFFMFSWEIYQVFLCKNTINFIYLYSVMKDLAKLLFHS